jgi:D-tyrosyl-tRNA(Tyr) deacylase
MRALLQRVSEAKVTVDGITIGQIGVGLLVFVGIHENDDIAQAEKLAGKILRLRVFPDEGGKMNLSVADISGELLIVSQFTLYGETPKVIVHLILRRHLPKKRALYMKCWSAYAVEMD